MKLDLGCGNIQKPGYVGIDREKFDGVKYVLDLEKEKLPFKEGEVEAIYANMFFEHVENPTENIKDCFRVLKKGGILEINVPYFAHPSAYVPMHKTFWSITTKNILNDSYHEDFGKWINIEFDYEWGNSTFWKPIEIIFDFIIKKSPMFYEKRLSRMFPFAVLKLKLTK